jgi:hypothetical protein
MYFPPIYPISQCLHPTETAMLNHQKKKKIKQDPIPKIMRSGLSLSTSFFIFFSVVLMVQDGSVTEAPDLVMHTKKDVIQRRRMKIFELRLKQSKSNVKKKKHTLNAKAVRVQEKKEQRSHVNRRLP